MNTRNRQLASAFRSHGPYPRKTKVYANPRERFKEMLATQLRAMAKSRGILGTSKKNKEQLIDLLS